MSFFDPLPQPQTPTASRWSPPAWDRPSEGTFPALVPVNELVLRTDAAVAAVECLRVYPNGFVVQLAVLFNPRESARPGFAGPGFGDRADPIARFPRVGVRFADGREGGRKAGPFQQPVRTDDAGMPIEIVVRSTGGGGGSHGIQFGAWVYPLPPDGPLEIHVSIPAFAAQEGHVTLDGGRIREAAADATVIWS